jgi:hypothetical protein
MATEAELLALIEEIARAGNYRVRPHAARHMLEEGFTESDMLEARTGKCRVLEDYPAERRCLVLGYYQMSASVRSPLHMVCEFVGDDVINLVTA